MRKSRNAIINDLHAIRDGVKPVSVYEVGTVLVPQFTEHELADAVIALHDRRIIELMTGNRVQLSSSKNALFAAH